MADGALPLAREAPFTRLLLLTTYTTSPSRRNVGTRDLTLAPEIRLVSKSQPGTYCRVWTRCKARSITSDELDPPLASRALTAGERKARERGRETDAALEPVVRPRIAAHISACRQALDVIEAELDRMSETLSIDPTASTRASALWLLLGRCVGQQRAVLLLAEHGVAVEGRPIDRTIKEMTNLIKAMGAAGPVAEKLARQWLADGEAYVKAQASRRGTVAAFKNTEKEAEAFSNLGLRSLDEADRTTFNDLSRAAHGRRSSMLESYYAPTRQMARGAGYPLLDQAIAVEWASVTTNGVVLAASAMLLGFYGQDYVESNVLCLMTSIDAIRQTQPLDAEKIAREVGLSRYPFWPPAG